MKYADVILTIGIVIILMLLVIFCVPKILDAGIYTGINIGSRL